MNSRRMNRLEELGRVDAEKAKTRMGARNLKDEKKRIVRELKADGGKVRRKKENLASPSYGIKKLKKGMMDKYQKREKFDEEVDLDKVAKSQKVRRSQADAQGMRKERIKKGIDRRNKKGTSNYKNYRAAVEAQGGNIFKSGGKVKGVKEDSMRDRMKQPLKKVQPNQKGLKKLPTKVRNKMGYMKKGGRVGMGKALRGGGCVR